MLPERGDFSNLLNQKLTSHGIDTRDWGKGAAKTFDDLVKEVAKRECIVWEKDGRLVRRIRTATIDVVHQNKNGETFRLFEKKQVFKDGRVRSRSGKLEGSLAEKLGPDELPQQAVERALREELKIEGEVATFGQAGETKEDEGESFPGLRTENRIFRFRAYLDSKQFKPGGYVEEQPDKTTYFCWKQIIP